MALTADSTACSTQAREQRSLDKFIHPDHVPNATKGDEAIDSLRKTIHLEHRGDRHIRPLRPRAGADMERTSWQSSTRASPNGHSGYEE